MPSHTGKKAYPTEAMALYVMKMEQDRCIKRKKKKMPLSAYKCKICDQWHLTSEGQHD